MIYRKGSPVKHKVEKFDLDADSFVYVKELGSKEWQELKAKYPDDSKAAEITIAYELIAQCVVDDQGNRIFDDAADVEASLNAGLSAIWALRDKIFDLSRSKASEKK